MLRCDGDSNGRCHPAEDLQDLFMLHVSISLRALVFALLLGIVVSTGSDVVHSAPSMADTTVDGSIIFTGPGVDGARDIRTSTNDGGLRFYNGNGPLTNPPDGAAIQFFGNDRGTFNGQAFIDSGAHENAAIIVRTASAGEAVAERLRIDALGRVKVGTPTNDNCDGAGDVCSGDDLVADGDVKADGNGAVKAAVLANCNNNPVSIIRSFNNVNSAPISISGSQTSSGVCTIDFGFDVSGRYIVATAVGDFRAVSVVSTSGNTATFIRWLVSSNGTVNSIGGNIYVMVY
jgi:hypothetical protein